MSLIEAVVLGVLQGLTEFLPISSSAHLRVIPALLGWDDPGAALSAVIQIGTLFAVYSYFYKDIKEIVKETVSALIERQPTRSIQARLGWMIIIGTIPIVVFGLLLKDFIETTFRSLYFVGAMLIVFAIILWIAEKKSKKRVVKEMDEITWLDAIKIGIWQVLALAPGASRSGVTITGALFSNFTREAAARYSFLLSTPAILASGVYQLYKERDALFSAEIGSVTMIVAILVAGVVGYYSIAFLLDYLKRKTTKIFVIYRIVLGVIIILLTFFGVIN